MFTLKGTTNTVAKTSWATETKAMILAKVIKGVSAKEAIVSTATELGIELKPSYTEHAASHVYRFRKEIEKVLANPKHKEYDRVARICQENGIVNDV